MGCIISKQWENDNEHLIAVENEGENCERELR